VLVYTHKSCVYINIQNDLVPKDGLAPGEEDARASFCMCACVCMYVYIYKTCAYTHTHIYITCVYTNMYSRNIQTCIHTTQTHRHTHKQESVVQEISHIPRIKGSLSLSGKHGSVSGAVGAMCCHCSMHSSTWTAESRDVYLCATTQHHSCHVCVHHPQHMSTCTHNRVTCHMPHTGKFPLVQMLQTTRLRMHTRGLVTIRCCAHELDFRVG
jgi:hypothetical protein